MDKAKIREAFKKGLLQIKSVNRDDRNVRWSNLSDVMRHDSIGKGIYRVSLENGSSVIVTEDHSLISFPELEEVTISDITEGSILAIIEEGKLAGNAIAQINKLDNREFMYDVCVPGDETFVLLSGIVAHNSYSISGVSLDIEKSSKYQAMKDEVGAEYDKLVDAAKRSIKIIVGLRQQKYGVGVQSALGPLNRPGVQSRKNLISSSSGSGYV